MHLFQRKQKIHKNRADDAADRPIQGIVYKLVGVFLRNEPETLVKHTSVHRFEIKFEPQSNRIHSQCSKSSEMDTC